MIGDLCLKLLPVWRESSTKFGIKSVFGEGEENRLLDQPLLLSEACSLRYYRGPDYMEIDIDTSQSPIFSLMFNHLRMSDGWNDLYLALVFERHSTDSIIANSSATGGGCSAGDDGMRTTVPPILVGSFGLHDLNLKQARVWGTSLKQAALLQREREALKLQEQAEANAKHELELEKAEQARRKGAGGGEDGESDSDGEVIMPTIRRISTMFFGEEEEGSAKGSPKDSLAPGGGAGEEGTNSGGKKPMLAPEEALVEAVEAERGVKLPPPPSMEGEGGQQQTTAGEEQGMEAGSKAGGRNEGRKSFFSFFDSTEAGKEGDTASDPPMEYKLLLVPDIVHPELMDATTARVIKAKGKRRAWNVR